MSDMHKIRKIPQKDFDALVTIVANAYPGFGIVTDEDRRRAKRNLLGAQRQDPTICFYGLYRSGKLIGIMRLHDFAMNIFSKMVPVGGVGMVAVDLAHKKEKVCKELIDYFLEHYLKKGACLAVLYPFRPDFYRKMGFGYGVKHNEYRIAPGDLPRGKSKKHVQLAPKFNEKALTDCYNRVARRRHGMIEKCRYEWRFVKRPENRVVVYREDGKIRGYIVFTFKKVMPDQPLTNNLNIVELVYENRIVFRELMTFLHTQTDQVNRVVFSTQDDNLHFLPFDPRDGSRENVGRLSHRCNLQGIGAMYRVIDIPGIFRLLKEHNFGRQNLRLRMSIHDSFFAANSGNTIIHFVNGKPHLKRSGNYDATITLDISDFSSLLMGSVDFRSLYLYGLADISDAAHVNTVNRLFRVEERPDTITQF
ncbi:MAG: GNAT family N-acetyltransferase [Candidatus Zixiibacteriota bacterium]|nr:MAG: GNAT family N-acetyltransferase [candidate division Zixibacteria bacterium]